MVTPGAPGMKNIINMNKKEVYGISFGGCNLNCVK
jgi:hypothetical protein